MGGSLFGAVLLFIPTGYHLDVVRTRVAIVFDRESPFQKEPLRDIPRSGSSTISYFAHCFRRRRTIRLPIPIAAVAASASQIHFPCMISPSFLLSSGNGPYAAPARAVADVPLPFV